MPHTKTQVSKYNSLYYRKKKAALRERGELMKQQFEEGIINAQEYKKFLVGHERSLFTRTMDIEAAVHRRMAELKNEGTGKEPGDAAERLAASLERMKCCQDMVAQARTQIINLSQQVLEIWDEAGQKPDRQTLVWQDTDNRPRYQSIEDLRGFRIPDEPSIDAFYTCCAMFTCVDSEPWDPWDPSVIRRVKRIIRTWCDDMLNRLPLEAVERRQRWEGLVGVFEGSYEMFLEEQTKNTYYDDDEGGDWHEEVRIKFTKAREDLKQYYMPTFASHTPLWVMDLANSLANLWCEHSHAMQEGTGLESIVLEMLE
jgi:hypothetical protein